MRAESSVAPAIADDGDLYIQGQDGEWAPLHAESETRFFVSESDYRFVFVVDEGGQVTGMGIEIQGLALPPAEKIE